MNASQSPTRSKRHGSIRADGWTAERQLCFLTEFAATRDVGRAAAVAGMSRAGAYRLRDRPAGALFSLLWDRIVAPEPLPAEGHIEGYIEGLGDGRLMRLLGNHYRRERGDFLAIGQSRKIDRAGDRT